MSPLRQDLDTPARATLAALCAALGWLLDGIFANAFECGIGEGVFDFSDDPVRAAGYLAIVVVLFLVSFFPPRALVDGMAIVIVALVGAGLGSLTGISLWIVALVVEPSVANVLAWVIGGATVGFLAGTWYVIDRL